MAYEKIPASSEPKLVLSGSDKAPPTVATPVTFNFCVVVTPATMKSPKIVAPMYSLSGISLRY